MEVPLNITVMPLRGRIALAAALLALLAGGLAIPNAAHAAFTDNTVCKGTLKVGEKSVDFENPLNYTIACTNYITSYSLIVPGRSIDSIETEVFGIDKATGNVVPTDSFSCNGDLPGFGINCVGTYGGNLNLLPGHVNLQSGSPCSIKGAYFVVTYATYATNPDGTPKLSGGVPTVTTNTAGPFTMSRVQGCSSSRGTAKKVTKKVKHRRS
ncbi:hypothetical protein [Capillimicrobium parvum]|nr:hypothetical protein [Capillimicrobium parvum]